MKTLIGKLNQGDKIELIILNEKYCSPPLDTRNCVFSEMNEYGIIVEEEGKEVFYPKDRIFRINLCKTKNLQIDYDKNPECGDNFINLASHISPTSTRGEAELQAFKYGFKLGWQCAWCEQNERFKELNIKK